MLTLRSLRALGALDADSLLADPMLRLMALVPLGVALAVRLLLPVVIVRLGELAATDLGWLQAPLSGYVVVAMAPLLAGVVVGFLLLDQRDDRTLLALRVTPLPIGAYIAYRLAAPALAAFAVTLAAVVLAGGLGLTPGSALLAALAAAPLAPTASLALAAFARNKVEGLALVKAASVFLAAPLAALFLSPVWQTPFFALPTYLVARAVWAIQAGELPWAFVAASWALGAGLALLLLRGVRRSLEGA